MRHTRLQNAFTDVQVEEEEEEVRCSVTGPWLAGMADEQISEGADGPNLGGVGVGFGGYLPATTRISLIGTALIYTVRCTYS